MYHLLRCLQQARHSAGRAVRVEERPRDSREYSSGDGARGALGEGADRRGEGPLQVEGGGVVEEEGSLEERGVRLGDRRRRDARVTAARQEHDASERRGLGGANARRSPQNGVGWARTTAPSGRSALIPRRRGRRAATPGRRWSTCPAGHAGEEERAVADAHRRRVEQDPAGVAERDSRARAGTSSPRKSGAQWVSVATRAPASHVAWKS